MKNNYEDLKEELPTMNAKQAEEAIKPYNRKPGMINQSMTSEIHEFVGMTNDEHIVYVGAGAPYLFVIPYDHAHELLTKAIEKTDSDLKSVNLSAIPGGASKEDFELTVKGALANKKTAIKEKLAELEALLPK